MIVKYRWKKKVIEVEGMLLSLRSLKSLDSHKNIQPIIILASLYGKPSTTIITYYSPTYASDETGLYTFYNELSSRVRNIPKHSVLIIGWDMNAEKVKN